MVKFPDEADEAEEPAEPEEQLPIVTSDEAIHGIDLVTDYIRQ